MKKSKIFFDWCYSRFSRIYKSAVIGQLFKLNFLFFSKTNFSSFFSVIIVSEFWSLIYLQKTIKIFNALIRLRASQNAYNLVWSRSEKFSIECFQNPVGHRKTNKVAWFSRFYISNQRNLYKRENILKEKKILKKYKNFSKKN